MQSREERNGFRSGLGSSPGVSGAAPCSGSDRSQQDSFPTGPEKGDMFYPEKTSKM